MNLSPIDTAHSTVRVLNDLVGEATGIIEDALPTRKKKSSHRSTWAALAAIVVAGMVAAKVLMSKRRSSSAKTDFDDLLGTTISAADERSPRGTSATTDRQRESVAAAN